MGTGHLLQHGDHQLGIVLVAGADQHLAAASVVGAGVGGGRRGEEGLVGHHQFGVVAVAPEGGGPQPQLAHLAGIALEDQHITGMNRTLEQQPQAAHEVGENLLDPEAQAHRQATGDGGDGGAIETDPIGQPDAPHPDQQVAHDEFERLAVARAHPHQPTHHFAEQHHRQLGEHHQEVGEADQKEQIGQAEVLVEELQQGHRADLLETIEAMDQPHHHQHQEQGQHGPLPVGIHRLRAHDPAQQQPQGRESCPDGHELAEETEQPAGEAQLGQQQAGEAEQRHQHHLGQHRSPRGGGATPSEPPGPVAQEQTDGHQHLEQHGAPAEQPNPTADHIKKLGHGA